MDTLISRSVRLGLVLVLVLTILGLVNLSARPAQAAAAPLLHA